ncbi:uncharacterized protein LOC132624378 [Lycium barbarum]|uniref:uncharacterized protein LOC132624378 n=1 Tax=Lycium barbarum TaxID=112863 RepID=UPI00293E99AD|nr:uncharacterized protein LOC132624378 [Lycium barbarum]
MPYKRKYKKGNTATSQRATAEATHEETVPTQTAVPTAPTASPPNTSDMDMRGAIQLLTHIVANQAQRQESAPCLSANGGSNSSRTQEFLRMKPPTFTGTKAEEDPQNYIDGLQKVFRIIHVTETEAAEYAPHMVPDMRATVRRFVLGLKPELYRDAKTAAQNDKMTISKILAFVQGNEAELKEEEALQKQKDKEFNKRAKSSSNFSQGGGRRFFKNRSARPTPSAASAPVPNFKNDKKQNFRPSSSHSQANVGQSVYTIPACSKCTKRHLGECRMGTNACYGCGQKGHIQKDCPSARQGTGESV